MLASVVLTLQLTPASRVECLMEPIPRSVANSFLAILAAFFCIGGLFAQELRSEAPNEVKVDRRIKVSMEAGTQGQVRLLEPVAIQSEPPRARNAGSAQNDLTVEVVVQQVLARNQSLAQMTAAAQAAAAKFPQVTSPEDPMLTGMVAPNSFGSRNVEPGYRVEVSQKLLWPAKKNLRGEMALSEAGAAGSDVEDMKLQLTEMARSAYYDYFLVHRAIAVNQEALRLLEEFRLNADTRFRTGQIPQQDILQADVEIGKQRERGITLDRMRRVAIAKINTLMHHSPSEPLASPPAQLMRGGPLPPANILISTALGQRPDLRALESRIASDRAAMSLAIKEYWPDLEVTAAYDTIMGNGQMRDLAPQVGIRMNLPVRTGKRNAAVAEAQAKIAQRTAELCAKIDSVKFQVQEAYEQVREMEQILELYEGRILPQAQENVKSAQNAYVTGKTPFFSLIEAQRSLVSLRERNFEATADYFRRRATLERLIGQSP